MNRRQMLAGSAAFPVAALPLAGIAAPVNGTDAAWRALLAATAETKAAGAAYDDAIAAVPDGVWPGDDVPTVALPRLTGGEPLRLTLAELRDARCSDRLLLPPDDLIELSLRDMLDREMKLRQMRTPESIAERAALYRPAGGRAGEAGSRPTTQASASRPA